MFSLWLFSITNGIITALTKRQAYERCGKIKSIQRGRNTLILTNEDGFDGDYIGGDTETLVSFEDIWEE